MTKFLSIKYKNWHISFFRISLMYFSGKWFYDFFKTYSNHFFWKNERFTFINCKKHFWKIALMFLYKWSFVAVNNNKAAARFWLGDNFRGLNHCYQTLLSGFSGFFLKIAKIDRRRICGNSVLIGVSSLSVSFALTLFLKIHIPSKFIKKNLFISWNEDG